MKGTGSGVRGPGSERPHGLAIVGGGISGLALAHFARRAGIEDLVVLEAGDRPGGKVQTEWIDGFCCEWGPQGFLDNVPETLELAGHLGLTGELVRAADDAADRFIARDGRLRRVPLAPPGFIFSDVLSLPGRLRVLLEPFQPRGAEEESVLEFATRRIGREAAEVLVDAMVTGVYAGDPARLSLPATFPRMRAMERDHGSLTRAMLAKLRERRRLRAAGATHPSEAGARNGDPGARRRGERAGPAGPGGTLTTFRRGMQQLTDAIALSFGRRVRLGTAVSAVTRDGERFTVSLAEGSVVRAERVSVALPPEPAARVLAGLLPTAACEALAAIPAVKVAVVMTGYRSPRPFRRPTRGFGFLVPGREQRRILGTIYCNSTFPPHAPAGATLLRTLLGGARDGAVVDLPDNELLALVRRELEWYLGGDPEPDFVHIIRHRYAIPQYTLGHLERLAAVTAAIDSCRGLSLVGNGYRGIALNSCVAEARSVAAGLAALS